MKGRKGFFLLETIIAGVILFLVLVFTAPFILTTYKKFSTTEKIGTSADVVEVISSYLNNINYEKVDNSLNNGAVSCKDALENNKNVIEIQKNGKDVKYGVYFNVKETVPGAVKEVKITICWKDRGKLNQREVILEKTKG